ncbi:MAG: hypothetical protein WC797_02060 [Candidatus Paceibacterota bacterium]|jgi:hypothetical protein
MQYLARCKNKKGFSLVEILIGSGVLILIFLALWQAFNSVMSITLSARQRVTATSIGNQQVELIRNLAYVNVGVMGGNPAGIVVSPEAKTVDGVSYSVTTSISYVDDAADGLSGGNPNDLSPNDYKKVQVDVSCQSCKGFKTITLVTNISE